MSCSEGEKRKKSEQNKKCKQLWTFGSQGRPKDVTQDADFRLDTYRTKIIFFKLIQHNPHSS
jgi:hypothetical protein